MSDMDEVQQRVGEWGAVTFPEATDQSILRHLRDEVEELGSAATMNTVAEELADVQHLLFHLACRNGVSLHLATMMEFDENQGRMWRPSARGYWRHQTLGSDKERGVTENVGATWEFWSCVDCKDCRVMFQGPQDRDTRCPSCQQPMEHITLAAYEAGLRQAVGRTREQSGHERPSIYDEIQAERERQEWHGDGADQDGRHGVGYWLQCIQQESTSALTGMLKSPGWLWSSLVRARLVQIAALAVAGIESIDRAAKPRPTEEGQDK